MSLAEAVLDIADQLETEGVAIKESHVYGSTLMISFARQLRSAVKAAAGNEPKVIVATPQQAAGFAGPITSETSLEVAAAREEFRKKKLEQAERESVKMVTLYSSDGESMIGMPSDMPVGAKTMIDGKTYKLHPDGALREVLK